MNDIALQADINRAEHAQRLLNDELLKEVLAAMKAELHDALMDCPQRDKDGKEAIWQLMKTQQKFVSMLRGYIETGKLATANLKHFEERKGLLRVFG